MARPTWLDALVGHELREAYEIEVHFANERPLTTGDVVIETDRGWFQLISVHPDRRVRTMRTPSDVELIGDWEGRTGIVLLPTQGIDLAFRVARIDYVQHGSGLAANDTIGVFLLGEANTVRIGILLDPEDVAIGPPKVLWDYLAQTARDDRSITIYGKSG
jgi:hypothetical protein